MDIPDAKEGDMVTVSVDPSALNFPDRITQSTALPVEGTFDNGETRGLEVLISVDDTLTTFRLPRGLYEIESTLEERREDSRDG